MLGNYRVRTDLALESREKFEKDNVEVSGVVIHEDYDRERDIRTTVVKIETEHGARMMEKPMGTYITLEAPGMAVPDEGYHREISEKIAGHIRRLAGLDTEKSVLVAGLGNLQITPDALGPGQCRICESPAISLGNTAQPEPGKSALTR